MKKLILILLLIPVTSIYSQTKNFIDLPYLETSAKVDTLVTPDRIYLTVLLLEKDTKGKISLEELETKMVNKLKVIGIDVSKQLTLTDLSSDFKKYFLKQQDVQKAKMYSVLVYDAKTAGKVIVELEEENISNITLEKTEYSKMEELKLELKSRAILKAKQNALAMVQPLNQKVGVAIYISDSNSNSTNVLQGRVGGIMIRGASSLTTSKYEYIADDIEFEKIKVESEVFVKFKIE
ncbi:SIMPL domain-containing protein [Flavobacterium sp.]|uniref:SIMPL domain-containing protein n=1 Tax=Flavobacterium sp. TaxID=239 RepID=UPI0025B7D798|nr:SIMPL domain-containing protein [Flavobacterium sp.]MBA4154345.1 SIMPL domain-containing protein [Flavobacterium sp.]